MDASVAKLLAAAIALLPLLGVGLGLGRVLVLHRSRGPQPRREKRRVPDRHDRRRHDRSDRDFRARRVADPDLRCEVRIMLNRVAFVLIAFDGRACARARRMSACRNSIRLVCQPVILAVRDRHRLVRADGEIRFAGRWSKMVELRDAKVREDLEAAYALKQQAEDIKIDYTKQLRDADERAHTLVGELVAELKAKQAEAMAKSAALQAKDRRHRASSARRKDAINARSA
jgi:hypothetical protein